MSIGITICAIILYYTVGKRYQSWILIALSLFVYWQVAQWNILLLFSIALIVGICSSYLERNTTKTAVAIPIIVIIAGFFFLRSDVGGLGFPLGYSVLAFTSISILIDQYRNPAHYRYADILSYLLFFPKIFAGPIERASNFISSSKKGFNGMSCYVGFKYLIFAAFCKLVVADNLASTELTGVGVNLWMEIFVYSIGFFFDFWAYTLMAIGVGKFFGYDLSANFFKPYYSSSFREFWHRWNITLGTWLRDYIYIPLGGNKLPYIKWALAVLLVFIVSGVWHGTTLPFIVWGICHGILLIAERGLVTLQKLPLLKVAYSIVVFILVSLLWQLFIVDSLGSAIKRYASLFDSEPFHGELAVKLVLSSLAYVLLTSSRVFSLIQKSSDNRTFVITEVSMLAVMLSALILLNCPMSFNFFYFRF